MYGGPALKVRGTMFACMATNKAAEPDTLVVRMGFAERDALIEEEPETYYLKDHYRAYPCVLVRLARVGEDALRDLLGGARRWVEQNMRPARRNRSRVRRSTRSD